MIVDHTQRTDLDFQELSRTHYKTTHELLWRDLNQPDGR